MSTRSNTDTVVIGAGQAGLAVSRQLTLSGVDHVVLERGRVAESWRSERWDSLNLLTPNWMSRLPGWLYTGADQEGYMSAGRYVRFLESYASSFEAPVLSGTTVDEVSQAADGYRVVTDKETWRTRHVIIATGPFGRPKIPGALKRLDPDVAVVTANRYRNPAQLPVGGVLVVGASSSGLQIAEDLARAGRRVILAVGRHTRMPRRYRGMDIFWWLERTGRLARTIDEMPDAALARRDPSMQLVGRNDPNRHPQDLDLAALQAQGVRLVGRLEGVDGTTTRFRGDLAEKVDDADARMHRFLDAVDRHIDETGLTAEVWPGSRPRPVDPPAETSTLDLRTEGVGTVLLATGYRPHVPWLRLPITTPDGAIAQHRGVTPAPGVYVVGQRFQHRRDSTFIDGARHDARDVVAHLSAARRAFDVNGRPGAAGMECSKHG